MDLSIIVLNYNTRDYLLPLLNSIKEADFGQITYEVIVVDNGSDDDSVVLVKKKYRWVRLVETGQNFGFSRANNIGARFAKGKYLLFLNSDTLVEPNSIQKLYDFAQSSSQYVGGTARLELVNGRLDPACHRGFPTPWNAFCYFTGLELLLGKIKIFGGYHQKWKNIHLTHQVDCISGACFLIRRDVFEKIGRWDESYFMYGEDIDLCYQLSTRGYKLFFYPEVKITHFKKRSGREKISDTKNEQNNHLVRKKTKEHFYYTMKLFYQKNYKDKYPKLVYRLVLLGIKILNQIKK